MVSPSNHSHCPLARATAPTPPQIASSATLLLAMTASPLPLGEGQGEGRQPSAPRNTRRPAATPRLMVSLSNQPHPHSCPSSRASLVILSTAKNPHPSPCRCEERRRNDEAIWGGGASPSSVERRLTGEGRPPPAHGEPVEPFPPSSRASNCTHPTPDCFVGYPPPRNDSIPSPSGRGPG